MKLQLATGNQHKIQEVKSILGSDAGIDLIGFEGEEPVENGLTFYENALIKARSGFPKLALQPLQMTLVWRLKLWEAPLEFCPQDGVERKTIRKTGSYCLHKWWT